jgi:hypothetical protein
MRRISLAISAALLTSALSTTALADGRGVGLGVGAGVAVPTSSGSSLAKPDFKAALNWGFFVDIPLLYTFHITPSTLLYRLKDSKTDTSAAATDVSLNFKFIVPVGPIELFGGVTAGLTSSTKVDPHAGILAGFGFSILPNLEIFAQANYKFILRDDDVGGNVRDLQIYAGPLFKFL